MNKIGGKPGQHRKDKQYNIGTILNPPEILSQAVLYFIAKAQENSKQ